MLTIIKTGREIISVTLQELLGLVMAQAKHGTALHHAVLRRGPAATASAQALDHLLNALYVALRRRTWRRLAGRGGGRRGAVRRRNRRTARRAGSSRREAAEGGARRSANRRAQRRRDRRVKRGVEVMGG